MSDAPERIWAKLDRASVDGSGAARLLAMDRPFSDYRGDPATSYVRADLYDALEAENERLRDAQSGLATVADALEAWRDAIRQHRAIDPSVMGLSDMAKVVRAAENATRPGEATGPQG